MKRENLMNSFLTAAFALGLLVQFGITVRAAPGDPDLTFGIGGRVTTSTEYEYAANAVALQADDKIVVAGNTWDGTDYDLALARYLP